METCIYNLSTGEVELVDPWDSFLSQPSMLGEFQVRDNIYHKREMTLNVVFWSEHSCTYV